MPVEYKVLPDQRLLVAAFSGLVTREEFADAVAALSRDPAFRPDFDRLVMHHRGMDLSRFGFDDIIAIRDAMMRDYCRDKPPPPSDRPLYRLAAVSSDPISQEMLRLYGAVLNTGLRAPIAVETFSSLDEALTWLDRKTLIASMHSEGWRRFLEPFPTGNDT